MRNCLTHDAEKLSIEGSVRFLTKYWTELCNVQQKSSVYDTNGKSPIADSLIAGKQSKKRKEPTKWQKPDAGWIKINVDGAYDDNTREGGIGIVIRDDMMAIKLTAWKHIVRAEDAEEVEALACVEGMKLAQEWCPARAIVAIDCASVVALLQQHEDQRSRLKFIVDEAKAAGDELPEWTVIHTKRESNRVAHELAQLAKRTRHSAVWRFAAPTCVEQYIAQDCMNFSE